MVIDEELYRQYLRGDEAGLEALMRKYGNPLTLYINICMMSTKRRT